MNTSKVVLCALLLVACEKEGGGGASRGPLGGLLGGESGKAKPGDAYRHVDEVVADDGVRAGTRVKLHGFVVAGSISRGESGELRFRLEHGKKSMAVSVPGPPPDAFRDLAEVVVTGTVQAGEAGDRWRLQGTELMAKCPDDYKPPR